MYALSKFQIGRLAEREAKENEGQGERVTECEATVARQGNNYDDEDGEEDEDGLVRMKRMNRMMRMKTITMTARV